MPRLRANQPPEWPEHLREWSPEFFPDGYSMLRERLHRADEFGFPKLACVQALVGWTVQHTGHGDECEECRNV